MKQIFISLFFLAAAPLSAFGVIGGQTFYQMLGVSESASQNEIKLAWRKRISKAHPDRNHSPLAESQFISLQTAYKTLSRPKERKDYNRELRRLRRAGRLPLEQKEKPAHSAHQEIRPPAAAAEIPAEEIRPDAAAAEIPAEEIRPDAAAAEIPAEEISPPAAAAEIPAEEISPPAAAAEIPAEKKTGHSINQEIRRAAEAAMEELYSSRPESGGGEGFQKRRSETDRSLHKALESVFLNADFSGIASEGFDPLVIPAAALRFPQSLSFLLERGADAAFAPSGERPALELASVLKSGPEALRAILRHNRDYINRKSSKGTPIFSLILKRIRQSLHEGREGAAQAWQGLADEILSGEGLDLSLQDARGADALETAVALRLNRTAVWIYFKRQRAGGLNLESEIRERLIPAAAKAGNIKMIEFLKAGESFENALTTYSGGPQAAFSGNSELRESALAISVILGGSAFGLYVEAGAESDWPLWVRALPWTVASFIPAGLVAQRKPDSAEMEKIERAWKENLREEGEAAKVWIKAAASHSARLASQTGAFLKRTREAAAALSEKETGEKAWEAGLKGGGEDLKDWIKAWEENLRREEEKAARAGVNMTARAAEALISEMKGATWSSLPALAGALLKKAKEAVTLSEEEKLNKFRGGPALAIAEIAGALAGGGAGLLAGGIAGISAVPLAFDLLLPGFDAGGGGAEALFGMAALLGGIVSTSAGLIFGAGYGGMAGVKTVDACYKVFFQKSGNLSPSPLPKEI